MRTIPFFVSILALAACNGGPQTCDTCPDTDPVDTSTCDPECDTDTDVTQGHAWATLNSDETCPVALTGEKSTTGWTNAKITLEAPGTYHAAFGTIQGLFDFPVCVSTIDGRYKVGPDYVFQLQENEDENYWIDFWTSFEPGQYACSYEKYAYDAGSPDHKGDFLRHVDLDLQDISVDQLGQIWPLGNVNMDVVGDGDDIISIVDDQIVLVEVNGTVGAEITASEIANDSFALTVVSPSGFTYVADLTCLRTEP